jgi:hypothetical protein
MAYSIYDSFLTISDCKYYCKQVAKKLGLTVYDYFYDKYTETQFPGDSNIYQFFNQYEQWRIRFNLTQPRIISRIGLEEYVSKNRELKFNLTIKGFSFIYVCKFSIPNEIRHGSVDNNTQTLYIEDSATGQYSFVL